MKVFKYTLLAILFFVCVAHMALGFETASEAVVEVGFPDSNALEVASEGSLLEADASTEVSVDAEAETEVDRRRRRKHRKARRHHRKARRARRRAHRKARRAHRRRHRKARRAHRRRRRHARRHARRHRRRHARRAHRRHRRRAHRHKKHHLRRLARKFRKHARKLHRKIKRRIRRHRRKHARRHRKHHKRRHARKHHKKHHGRKHHKKHHKRRHARKHHKKHHKRRHARKHHKKHHGRKHHKKHHKRHHGRRHHKKHHGRRHHKKHRHFRPKHQKFGGSNGKLTKKLHKIVTTQPESATVKVGKHWAFEKSVLKKLNKYVKGSPKELIEREQLIERETHEVCSMVDNHCGSTNPKAMTNTKTCVLTKNACFKYKIALEKVRRAKKQCQNAHKMKLRDDFMGKLDAQVEVAKCLRYVKSVDHYLKQGGKKFAAARVAEVLDNEATTARTKVDDATQELKKLEAEEKRFAPAYKACKKWADKSKDCNDRGDFGSADCAAARAKSSKCEAAGDLEYYSEAHAKLKAHKENMENLEAERNTAETTALRGEKK